MSPLKDFKYALRLLAKKPSFTILTVLVMATGIGLSVFLFSFLNTTLFKDLPFEDGGSLVRISASQNGVRGLGNPINLHDYQEIRNSLKGLTEFGAYKSVSLNVSSRDGSRRYNAIIAEPNIFRITRTQPVLGRAFLDSENQSGAERVVVIGYDIWQNQFSGSHEVIGQNLRINGTSHHVIGVMPENYYFPNRADLWLPMREQASQSTRGNSGEFFGMAHLDGSVSKKEVNRALEVIMQRLEGRYPKTNTGINAFVDTFPMQAAGDGISVAYAMQVAAVLILVLASINVGNLLLSRGIERGKETAIRVALGAPRSHLISQMLWESIIICTVGGVIGLLVLAWGLDRTQAVAAGFFVDKPAFWWQFGLDGYTLTLFFAFLIGTILLTGLLPAWRNSGEDINSVLRDGTRGALSKKAGRLNRILVISEIFISVAILISAAVIMIGTYKSTHADYGATTQDILAARVYLTDEYSDAPLKRSQFVKDIETRLESEVSVGDVMILSALPGEYSKRPTFAIEGREYSDDGDGGYPRANYNLVTPGSLSALGIDLKDGRYFSNADDGPDKATVIVTDSFVRQHFPTASPLGKRVRLVESIDNQAAWLTIVGVVEHTIQGRANEESGKAPSIFRVFSQDPTNNFSIALKMKANYAVVVKTLRESLDFIDPDIPAYNVESYDASIARNSAPLRFISTIFLIFGIAAVVLAASGIYGVMSNTIAQKTQEIGVRVALGAWDQRVIGEFLGREFKLFLWGGVPGLLVGVAMGFAMSQIFETGQTALVFVALGVVLIMATVLLLATYIPTKRALQMGPSDALRYE